MDISGFQPGTDEPWIHEGGEGAPSPLVSGRGSSDFDPARLPVQHGRSATRQHCYRMDVSMFHHALASSIHLRVLPTLTCL